MATRRSTRVAYTVPEGLPGPRDEDYYSEPDEKSEDDIPKRKKARTGGKRKAADSNLQTESGQAPVHKRVRGSRGLLKDVVDMPLDVILEVRFLIAGTPQPIYRIEIYRYLASCPQATF